MSDRNSSSSSTRYWAKLISPDSSLENASLMKDSYLVGHDASNDIQIKHARLDDFQCKIYKDAEGSFWIENLMLDSVIVDDETIGENGKKQLVLGNRINFVQKSRGRSKEVLGFVFCPVLNEVNQLKRNREETQQPNERKEMTKKNDKMNMTMKAELKCAICLDYIYCCVVVLPCLHNFCAACISEWIDSSDSCPHCRGEATELRKNPSLNNIIETYMEENPKFKRQAEEYKEMDEKDIVKNCFEIMHFCDGSKYKGNTANGMKEGEGILVTVSGAYYKGGWSKNLKHGDGLEKFSNGSFYDGDWVRGMRQGQGVELDIDGSLYIGEWKSNMRDGKGKIVYSNGHIYDGDWERDRRQGRGVYTFSEISAYNGGWFNDVRHGDGKLTYSNGNYYEGEWRFDKKWGRGKFVETNGTVFDGLWVNDKKEGYGTMMFRNGLTYQALWIDGTMQQKTKPKSKPKPKKKIVNKRNK